MLTKKLSQIWNNKELIAEGIANSIFKKEHIEEVYQDRLLICNNCPLLDSEGKACAVPGTGPCCGSCGCSLKFKLRSLSSSCPQDKWQAVATPSEEDAIRASIL